MILEAESAYYIPALSKHDIKPFLKIETFLRGFAGCCFFQKLPPEGQLYHETYASKHDTHMIHIWYIYDTYMIHIYNTCKRWLSNLLAIN